jgi:ferrous iron transport protein A
MINRGEISLSELAVNEQAVIHSFANERPEIRRLASLGFTPGARVDMTQNFRHGPLIVTIRGTIIALGRGEAAKIFVRRSGW